MDSHWVHGRAGYRCRRGHNSTQLRQPGQPRNLYVREDVLLAQLIDQVAAESVGQDLVRRTDGDVRRQAAAVVSCLQTRALVVVHDDQSWCLAADS
jgi:site-specific DNA recombinase